MQMSNPIAERYIIAVEREAERNRLYSELLAAQAETSTRTGAARQGDV